MILFVNAKKGYLFAVMMRQGVNSSKCVGFLTANQQHHKPTTYSNTKWKWGCHFCRLKRREVLFSNGDMELQIFSVKIMFLYELISNQSGNVFCVSHVKNFFKQSNSTEECHFLRLLCMYSVLTIKSHKMTNS